EVGRGAQRAADQSLNLLREATDLAAFPARACVRAAREHGVLGGDPAGPAAAAPVRHEFVDARRAQHACASGADQARSLRVRCDGALESHGAGLIRLAVAALRAHSSSSFMPAMVAVVERPGTSGTITTRPPASSTSARPTTVSGA